MPRPDGKLRNGASSAKSLRILFVTPVYFPNMGGVENHVYQVSRRLARKGVDVTVLTTDPEGELPACEESEGVKVQRVRAWPARKDYYFAPGVYSAICKQTWDIVHIQSYHTLVAPLAMLAARRAGLPYVVTFHGGGHSSRLRHALRRGQHTLLRPLLVNAERLVATAKFEIELFGERLRIPADKFVFIPNGGDILAADHGKRHPGKSSLLISIGRLERYKGHHRVIAALPKVLEQRPDVRLWIAGSGPFETALRRLSQKLNVEERVEIRAIPASERQAMAEELSRAALVILLSEYETHPMGVLEALALGRPALVADTSGLRELAEQGLVRAIPLDSQPEQVAAAILEQLRKPLVPPPPGFLSWDDCASKLHALYHEISQGTR